MAAEELRTVVVTGASTGIGASCAQYLDEKGFRVFATVRKQSDADGIAARGRSRLKPLFLDVTDAESIAKAAQTVDAVLYGAGLAGLVNNAGVSVDVPLECVDIGALRHQLEVNAIAPVVVTQAFLPLLRRAQGRVVNVSSINGRVASPFSGPYCMSKFALEAFTDCLRQELADWAMHVAAVEPGAIGTAIWGKGREDDWCAEASKQNLDLYGEAYRAFRKFSEQTQDLKRHPSRHAAPAALRAPRAYFAPSRPPASSRTRSSMLLVWSHHSPRFLVDLRPKPQPLASSHQR